MEDCSFDIWEQNLKLIDKYSLSIDGFSVSDKNFQKLIEFNRDKLTKLQIYNFFINDPEYEISEEAIKIIREIHPTYFVKCSFWANFDEIKDIFSTNSANIDANFIENKDLFVEFTFWNSQFLLFDSIDSQKLFFECESVALNVNTKGFEKMHLVKADKDNHEDSNLKTVLNLSL